MIKLYYNLQKGKIMFHSHEKTMFTNIIVLLSLNSYHDIIIGHRGIEAIKLSRDQYNYNVTCL